MEPRGFMTALFDYSFTSFVTPKIIKILYLLATVVVALSTLVLVLAAFNTSSGAGILTLVIVGPLFFLISMIYARVLLELVIVFFRINGNVQELRDGRSGGPVQPAPTPAPPAVDTAVVAPAETAITIERAAETPPTAASSPEPEPEPEPEASARFCENCGAERRPEARFCTSCGHA
jgi:outer membrane biosynthesis protein TonB